MGESTQSIRVNGEEDGKGKHRTKYSQVFPNRGIPRCKANVNAYACEGGGMN